MVQLNKLNILAIGIFFAIIILIIGIFIDKNNNLIYHIGIIFCIILMWIMEKIEEKRES